MAQVIPPVDETGQTEWDAATLAEVREYIVLAKQIKDLESRRAFIKDRLVAVVEELGEPDGNGHQFLPLPSSITEYAGFQRQRRATQVFDPELAEKILQLRGVDDVYRTERVIDQDLLYQAVQDERLTPEDVALMFPIKETFAFVPVKK